MPVYRKVNGSWETTTQYRKVDGSWQRATVYYKDNGTWLPVSGLTIDNFDDGDRAGWTVPSSTGGDSVISPGLDGSDSKWEHDGFREGHLAGADAVDRGPQPGDVWEFWFQITSDNGNQVINRVEFSADGTADDDMYRIEFERNTGDTELSLEKFVGGSQDTLVTDENFLPSIGQVYRCEIQWNAGDSNVAIQMFHPDGSTASNQIGFTDSSSGEFAQPGIYVRNSGNSVCEWDEFRIIQS